MDRKINPTLVDIVYLYDNKLIGFSESRNLLEAVFPDFIKARDKELDEYMAMIEQRENEEKTLEEEPPEPPASNE